ncbi:MAG: lipopolysaccharide biosynthesis protein [Saprospiraceae bacterium]
MKSLRSNSVATVIQVVIFSVCQFVLYRFVTQMLGIEKLGLWSVVSSFTMAASIGNFGASGSNVVMFVARYLSEDNLIKVKKVISTSLVFTAISTALILVILYPIAIYFFSKMLSPAFFDLASNKLIFLSFAHFMLYTISFLIWSVVDGYQLYVKRVTFYSIAQILNLALSIVFMYLFDIEGLFWALIIQYGFLAFSGLWIVYHLIPFKMFFCKQTFKEIFNYGVKLQAISLISTFSEPAIKYFLTKYGGLATTGYYELANKISNQVRNPILVGLQPLIPAIAEIKDDENKNERIHAFFVSGTNHVFDINLFINYGFIFLLPLISYFWIGSLERTFISLTIGLSVGNFFNTLVSPINYINFGTGRLRGNIIQQLFQSLITIICIIVAFHVPDSISTLSFGLGLSVGIASLFIVYYFEKTIKIQVFNTYLSNSWRLAFLFLTYLIFFFLYKLFSLISLKYYVVITLVVVVVVTIVFYFFILSEKSKSVLLQFLNKSKAN